MKYHVLLDLLSNEVICIDASFTMHSWFDSLHLLSLNIYSSGGFFFIFQKWIANPEEYGFKHLFSFTSEEFPHLQQLYPEYFL